MDNHLLFTCGWIGTRFEMAAGLINWREKLCSLKVAKQT
jgi:hypothetical protein